ncbi:MAG TPA: glycosyltransferase family 1 protein [Candidatus Scalindua sp.]|nr:glycosyltransferase family 1 protein [Candidatus Scalindua sp.]
MRVAINCQLLSMHRSGVGRYIRDIANALARIDSDNEYVLFTNSRVKNGILPVEKNFRMKLTRFLIHSAGSRIIWEQLFLPLNLRQERVDVVHFPGQSYPLLPFRCASVITVHDLTYDVYPETYTLSKRIYKNTVMHMAIARADKIIVDAKITKEDILHRYDIAEGKIVVINCGLNDIFKQIKDSKSLENTREKFGLPQHFILHVGTLSPGKNLVSLLNAYAILKRKKNSLHKLVVVGPTGWLYDSIFERVSHLRLKDDVIFLGYVEDVDLVHIYNLADIFVLVSLYEGFGFPPLEAMACGTPVITSNAGSLPEVVGEAALMVNPLDVEGLAKVVEKSLMDSALRDELIEKGFARTKLFSWEETARKTLAVYKEIGKKR